ncbi:alanyl-tRNA synthetase [Penicillium brasilianum]|uniref:Alanyl-tRNA synthetase n=1 Tax=Penicillium brasilianum TaxID=104259 RepID=A0A1S9RS02_PENBI|nr:alanyl-tRNA synthetase [Penicillium brasilianum]
MPPPTPTYLAYQHDAKLLHLETTIQSIQPFADLDEANKTLFKSPSNDDLILVTQETIFHPQGGGQPSDEGYIFPAGTDPSTTSNPQNALFQVLAARMDATNHGQVLHLVRPVPNITAAATPLQSLAPATPILQTIDAQKRLLYSRLHTAGHVLGSAVRHLLESSIPDFDELKASHFPDSASCEFRGSIPGEHKSAIQARVDEYIARAMPVEIEFWGEEDFEREGVPHLLPDKGLLAPGESKFRVVRIVGAEVYPCGGTHVDSTDLCGGTVVKKISRSKGNSRVSYAVV